MRTYRVHVKRWELHIDGVGVTQTRRLTEAEDMSRDYIAMALDIGVDTFAVNIQGIEVDADVDALADEAEQAQREAEQAQQKAVRKAGCTVAKLQERGLSNREIARYLRISPQRVSQISRRQAAIAAQQ